MKNVITISRETGSGGHTIGQMLAEKLGYDFYDGEIVDEIAGKLHAKKEEVETEGEYMDEDTEFDLASGVIPSHLFSRKEKVPFEKINELQGELVKKIAQKGNCVIVGRNADHILKDNEKAFHIFIHAGMEHRVARVLRHEKQENADNSEKEQMMCGNVAVDLEDDTLRSSTQNRIRHELELKDKTRAAHYNYFTNRTWGMVSNYNLMVDTSVMTKTQCCELIMDALEKVNGGTK